MKVKKVIEIELDELEGCPAGYTLINGICVERITPPPPGETDLQAEQEN